MATLAKKITDVKTRYRMTFSRWLAYNEEVCRFEEEHQIATHWTPTSPEFNDALVIVRQCTYCKALDEMELTKLGMSGVGT
jgi:hypothetical protein